VANEREEDQDTRAVWPERSQLPDCAEVPAPHPAIIPIDVLLTNCRLTAMRRGGPGGQHRNKVSSAIMVLHLPTNVSAEANERRDQAQNRKVAIERLRLRMALTLRTFLTEGQSSDASELEFRARWNGRPLKIAESNFDHVAVLTLLLDDLYRAGGQPSLVAKLWNVSTTSIVQFVATHPPALQVVNKWRTHHGRSGLRS